MHYKFKCLLVFLLFFNISLCAEQSSTSFFSIPDEFSTSNLFLEAGGGYCAPIRFFNQGIIPMTGNGFHFLTGVGYNWDGWLFAVTASHDRWSEGLEKQGLMENFRTNIVEFRVRRIISEQNISFLPSWFEIIPGFGLGGYFISTDYYPSLRAKQEGKLKSIGWGDAGTNCFFYRISFELAFPFGREVLIPFVGCDYNAFYDESIGGGFAGYGTVYLGLRFYPFNIRNNTSSVKKDKDFNNKEDVAVFKNSYDDFMQDNPDEPETDDSTDENSEDEAIEQEVDIASWGEPEASLQITPDFDFTPDGDEVNDEAIIVPSVEYLQYPPKNWNIKIYDRQNHLIRTFSDEGSLPESITWDGKTDDGENLISKNLYTARLTVIPDDRDIERTSVNQLEAEDTVETGILFMEIIPEKQWKIIVNTIYFDPDRATFNKISAEQRKANTDTLDSIAYQLSLRENVNVVVQGYANNVSNTERENIYELIPLSQLRANTIMELLIQRGIDSSILESEGLGGANPIAAWEDRANWWKNRRVEFIVTKIDEAE